MGKAFSDYSMRDCVRLKGAFLSRDPDQMKAFTYIQTLYSTVTSPAMWEIKVLEVFGDKEAKKKNVIYTDTAKLNECFVALCQEVESANTTEGYGIANLTAMADVLSKVTSASIDSSIKDQERTLRQVMDDIENYSTYIQRNMKRKGECEKRIATLMAIKAGGTDTSIVDAVSQILKNSFWQFWKVEELSDTIDLSFVTTNPVRQEYNNPAGGEFYNVNFGYVEACLILSKTDDSSTLKVFPFYGNLDLAASVEEDGTYRQDSQSHLTPNISSDGVVCWGTGKYDALEALNRRDYKTAFDLLASLLMTYSTGTPYRNICNFQRDQKIIEDSQRKWLEKLKASPENKASTVSYADVPTLDLVLDYYNKLEQLSCRTRGGVVKNFVQRTKVKGITCEGDSVNKLPVPLKDDGLFDLVNEIESLPSGNVSPKTNELDLMLAELKTRPEIKNVVRVVDRDITKDYGLGVLTHNVTENLVVLNGASNITMTVLFQNKVMSASKDYYTRSCTSNGNGRSLNRTTETFEYMILEDSLVRQLHLASFHTQMPQSLKAMLRISSRDLASYLVMGFELGQQIEKPDEPFPASGSWITYRVDSNRNYGLLEEVMNGDLSNFSDLEASVYTANGVQLAGKSCFDLHNTDMMEDSLMRILNPKSRVTACTYINAIQSRNTTLGRNLDLCKELSVKIAKATLKELVGTKVTFEYSCSSCGCDEVVEIDLKDRKLPVVTCSNCDETEKIAFKHLTDAVEYVLGGQSA